MITVAGNSLVIKTPYDAGFVQELKATVPATDRKFDPAQKAWMVAPRHGALVQGLILRYFKQTVPVPAVQAQTAPETRVLEIRYLGTVKERQPGQSSAFGFVGGQWAAVFPEGVLHQWFDGVTLDQPPSAQQTLYQVLSIQQGAGQDEIKKQFRRLAIQWHPDHCTEADAAERFMRIKDAYDLLSNPRTRARYDAGLALEATVQQQSTQHNFYAGSTWRPTLRCGYVLAEGQESLGRFVVSKILAWEDIINQRGQTLVSSWPMGAQSPVEVWA